MKNDILNGILSAEASGQRLLAVLIDPEKFNPAHAQKFLRKIPFLTTHIFIGGSTASAEAFQSCVKALKEETKLPIVLFPGDFQQISAEADALLFLSLLSGRNPDYLIGQQLQAVPLLQKMKLEIIPTAYLLLDGGIESAVERVSGTPPLKQQDLSLIVNTALAGQYLGKQLIYLEAGSGALNPVKPKVISAVKKAVTIPVLVGGGVTNQEALEKAYSAGANMVVIGTAFENGDFFL